MRRADFRHEVIDLVLEVRDLLNHDMSPPTPAMKPSSDVVAEYSSLLMGLAGGLARFS